VSTSLEWSPRRRTRIIAALSYIDARIMRAMTPRDSRSTLRDVRSETNRESADDS